MKLSYMSGVCRAAARYYRDRVFIPGDRAVPDFKGWLEEQGASLYIDKETKVGHWVVEFADAADLTAFKLKYSTYE